MKHINDLIHELDGADLYLRNRADTPSIPLNTCDIEEMLGIAKTVDNAARVLEKSIIPPCNIGDTVYRVASRSKKKRILPRTVCNMVYVVNYFGKGSWRIITTTEDILGETVFLTEEEAEAKIKNET